MNAATAYLDEIVDEWSHMLDGSTKPLLVGASGIDSRRALAPLPLHAAGGRLCGILGMTPKEYLKAFDRMNICVGEWDVRRARDRARSLVWSPRAAFVILGARVCRAFGVAFESFSIPVASSGLRAAGRC